MRIRILAFCILAIVACRKQDIAPYPVGEPVPYDGPVADLKATLEKSPYTLFKAAWKRAEMDKKLAKTGANAFTLFIPTDKAFADGGWTLDKINQSAPADLDTLLSYYTVKGRTASASLPVYKGNMAIGTLLKSATIPKFSNTELYSYTLFIGVYKDSLFVNGRPVSKWGTAVEAANATIYPLDKMVPMPKMDMLQYLSADPRFSLYLEASRLNDSVYMDNSSWNTGRNNVMMFTPAPYMRGQFTLFAPTNNAFHKQGFYTVDDLRKYLSRSLPLGYPTYDQNYYYVYPVTSLDTLLMPNRMNFSGGSILYNYSGETSNPVYFTNELLSNQYLSGMLFRPGRRYSEPPLYLPLEFSNNNGSVMVRSFKSTAKPLPLKEQDILVLNGVIHVVDDGLFIQ